MLVISPLRKVISKSLLWLDQLGVTIKQTEVGLQFKSFKNRVDAVFDRLRVSSVVKVMAGRPRCGRSRGVHVFAAMKAIGPVLHPRLTQLWDTVVPKLAQFLDGERRNTMALFFFFYYFFFFQFFLLFYFF